MNSPSLLEEKNLRIDSARMGAEIALTRLGLIKDEISQREAFRTFGEAKVRSWVNAGLCIRVKSGAGNAKTTYSRIELETIHRIANTRKL